jgi:hypothetical protein
LFGFQFYRNRLVYPGLCSLETRVSYVYVSEEEHNSLVCWIISLNRMLFQMGSCSLDRVSEFLIFNSLLISSLYIIYRGYKFLYLFPTSNKQFLYPTYILISGENHARRWKRKGSMTMYFGCHMIWGNR